MKRMDWAADLVMRPRRLLLVGVYGAALVTLTPSLRAHQGVVVPVLVVMALAGTLLYAREGIFVMVAPCEACGERSYVGSLRCDRTGTLRTAFTHPLLQAVVAIGLVFVIGAAAGGFRTVVLWLTPHGGAIHEYFVSGGYGAFRAYFLVYAMVASVPVPVVLGNLLRLVIRATDPDARSTG